MPERVRCPRHEHLDRRSLLKGSLVSAAGASVMNWGGRFNSDSLAAVVKQKRKHCILIWLNGGASQFETFDMKVGRPTGGLFREISTNVPGSRVCELMPNIAQRMDKLTVIRSMRTSQVDHPGGIYLMHTGWAQAANTRFPEIDSIVAKYRGATCRTSSRLPLMATRAREFSAPSSNLSRVAAADIAGFVHVWQLCSAFVSSTTAAEHRAAARTGASRTDRERTWRLFSQAQVAKYPLHIREMRTIEAEIDLPRRARRWSLIPAAPAIQRHATRLRILN